jgi:uncharacterized membrane protein
VVAEPVLSQKVLTQLYTKGQTNYSVRKILKEKRSVFKLLNFAMQVLIIIVTIVICGIIVITITITATIMHYAGFRLIPDCKICNTFLSASKKFS